MVSSAQAELVSLVILVHLLTLCMGMMLFTLCIFCLVCVVVVGSEWVGAWWEVGASCCDVVTRKRMSVDSKW